MRIHRRELLSLAGSFLALLLGLPRWARAETGALEIHQATRNTPLGALGAVGRRLFMGRGPPFKRYPGRPHQALPAVPARDSPALAPTLRATTRPRPFGDGRISLDTLARLLDLTNGITDGSDPSEAVRPLRAAPSAGALYPGELYLVADQVEGLDAGVYYCSVVRRQLVRLRSGRFLTEAVAALEDPSAAAGARAVVIVTNVFARSRVRYGNRGYRYALVDTGHIGENLRLAAAAVGLAEIAPRRFHDDRLNELLAIDGIREAACAAHVLGPLGEAPSREESAAGDPPESAADEDSAPQRAGRNGAARDGGRARLGPPPSLPDADDVVARYHAASKLVPVAGAPSRPAPSPEPGDPSAPAAAVALPGADPPHALGVEAAIRVRRSSRRIEREPVSAGELGWVVRAARRAREGAPQVALHLVVNRVADVPPGLYRALHGGGGLVLEREGSLAATVEDACLGQDKASRAAVVFLMVGDLAEAASREGPRSYRDLLLEAGALGQRLYLAAEAIGLTARNLAAFLDDRLNRVVGLDGERRAVLHLTVLGRGD